MQPSNQKHNLNVEIIPAHQAEEIDPEAWNQLGNNSLYANPFYERWNLLPALHHLGRDSDIFVVTITKQRKLVGLFPITLRYKFKKIKYLSLWEHDHCYLTNPLLSESIALTDIITQVGTKLNANWMLIPLHDPDLFDKNNPNIYSRSFVRAAVIDSNSIDAHLNSLKGKAKREIKRTIKKINQNFEVKHFEHQNLREGLAQYCELEHKGWKGDEHGSILSSDKVKNYYLDMIEMPEAEKKIIFQELWANDQLVAINMRMLSQVAWYDVKTSFNEEYKAFSPGKVLELKNLELIKKDSFQILDSCTSPDNEMINKYWPNQIKLQRSRLFFDSYKSRFWRLVSEIKQQISHFKKVLRHQQLDN